MFENFDGSSRIPRPIQSEALAWLEAKREKKRKALVGPVGMGKSAVMRAYQKEFGGVIVPPVNVLADQLERDYPEVNLLKGLSNYHCEEWGEDCETVRSVNDNKSCGDCRYSKCRQKVIDAEPSIVNPLALFYSKQAPHKPYPTVLIDECHRLFSLLELACSDEFSHSRYKFPEKMDSVKTVADWLTKVAIQYADLAKTYRAQDNLKKAMQAAKRCTSISVLRDRMLTNPANFVFWYEERQLKNGLETYLKISPVEVPRGIVNEVLGPYEDLIITSATLPQRWARKIFGTDDFEYKELDSPIPVENRPVYVKPAGLTAKSDPSEVAAWIKQQMSQHPGNTIVHVTYSMAKALTRFFPHALTHTAETKDAVMARFKAEGGMWLAPGCAEGIDLPGKQGETNLIPILPFANIGAPIVAARMALPMGRADYELDTLVNTIQAAGRTTRGADDRSTTVIGDARIMRLIQTHKTQIPRSFVEAVKYVTR
jgi:Rad3-related DNA helicase